jgi:acyl-CoA reductase-like NAD-dependent aldehyde dehydrogenase
LTDLTVVGPFRRSAVLDSEESFGSLAAATPVEGLAEAIAATNTGPFGLAATIHTRTLARMADKVAHRK